MYEHYRNDIVSKLCNVFTEEQISQLLNVLDSVSVNYNIERRTMDIVVYDYGIPELVKTYLVCKKIEGLSDNTLYNYRTLLELFFTTIHKNADEIATNDIRIYLYQYQKNRHISNRSLDKVRQCICSFYQWCSDENYIQTNPTKQIPKIKYEKKPRKALTQIELEHLRSACRTSRESAILETFYSTGCRVSELANLKIGDIDFTTKRYTCSAKKINIEPVISMPRQRLVC